MSTGTTPLEGIIAAVNPKGIRLQGESDWRNFSKFGTDVDACAPGQRVSITIDKSGFIRSLVNLDASGGHTPSPSPSPASPAATTAAHSAPSNGHVDKDRQIVRQSSLKAAVDVACHNWHTISVQDVLAIAEEFERWVYR